MKRVLVAGAGVRLTDAERTTAYRLGALLGREGYGLISGTWAGVDEAATVGFLANVPTQDQPNRIIHIDNAPDRSMHSIRKGPVIKSNWRAQYSPEAVEKADLGVIISGRSGSKPTMDALLNIGKPVIPLAWFGNDAFESLQQLLAQFREQRARKRLLLSLIDPACAEDETVSRVIGAAAGPEHSIFVSYHREDTGPDAGRVASHLASIYGSKRVFIDYSSLGAAAILDEIVMRAGRARIVLLLIGRRFVERVKNPKDFVAREVVAARAGGAVVLPVLVDVLFHDLVDLPDHLSFLLNVNGVMFMRDRWDVTVPPIEQAIDRALGITRMHPAVILE